MRDDPSREFEAAIDEAKDAVELACGNAVREFAKFVAKEWKMTEEEWRKACADPPPTGTYWDGYNAALDSIDDAAAFFLGTQPR